MPMLKMFGIFMQTPQGDSKLLEVINLGLLMYLLHARSSTY